MELSIIVPVYKVENYLRPCVESLLHQGTPDMEIILVDDASPDGCGALCHELAAKADCIRVLHHSENRGLSAARNTGIEAARGRYLTFVDSDDAVATDTYAQLMTVLHADPTIDLLEYPVCRHCGTTKEELWQIEEADVRTSSPDVHDVAPEIFRHWMTNFGHRHTYAWNKIYARHLFEHLRFAEGRYYEDTLLIIPLLQKVRHYHFSPIGGYLYYDRVGSISTSNNEKKVRDLLDGNLSMQRAMASFLESHICDPSLRLYRFEHLCTVVNTVIDLMDSGGSISSLSPLLDELDRMRPSLSEVRRLPMSRAARLKAQLWILLGSRCHCVLQHWGHSLLTILY